MQTSSARLSDEPPPYGWWAYLAIMILFNLLIFATPLLMQSSPAVGLPLYEAFHFTCHQLDSRSLCYFPNSTSVSDCTVQDGKLQFYRTPEPVLDGQGSYKLPVCSRDIAIYLSMLIGGLAWPLVFKPNSRKWLPIWVLLLALLPTALDGTTQLLGWRESSNSLRLLTGAIMGFGMAFFIIPLFNGLFFSMRKEKASNTNKK